MCPSIKSNTEFNVICSMTNRKKVHVSYCNMFNSRVVRKTIVTQTYF